MLTDDITRLCGEIVALRNHRGALMVELASGNKARRQSVADLCSQFGDLRAGMARTTGAARARFMNQLRQAVNVQRQAMQTDLAGARKAWAGKSR